MNETNNYRVGGRAEEDERKLTRIRENENKKGAKKQERKGDNYGKKLLELFIKGNP